MNQFSRAFCVFLMIIVAGCANSDDSDLNNDPLLDSADELPGLDGLPRIDRKSDELLPLRYTELINVMSRHRRSFGNVSSSVHAAIDYMEHFHIAAGEVAEDPFGADFSEMHLKWLVRSIQKDGSPAKVALQAIHESGVVSEGVWPSPTLSDLSAGTKPPDGLASADKHKLSEPRYLHPRDLKAHIKDTQSAVAVDLELYRQSWNLKSSELPVRRENWSSGIVMLPTYLDITYTDLHNALNKPRIHSILIIGWDDEMEAQRFDRDAELLFDEDGEPVMEKGFYLFRNSWNGDFGRDTEYGRGYGWISQAYLDEYSIGVVVDGIQ